MPKTWAVEVFLDTTHFTPSTWVGANTVVVAAPSPEEAIGEVFKDTDGRPSVAVDHINVHEICATTSFEVGLIPCVGQKESV